MNEFVSNLIEKIDIPKEARPEIESLSSKFEKCAIYNEYKNEFIKTPDLLKEILKKLEFIAKEYETHYYSLCFVFLLDCSKALYEKYKKLCLPEVLFYDSIEDLKYKLVECHNVYGIWGTFVAPWFLRFYIPDRFKLGRFQYEIIEFPYDFYEKDGVIVKKGDRVINIHIPSSGKLSESEMKASFDKAFEFYNGVCGEDYIVLVCNSWLLYKKHYEFLSENSNIIKFMDEFDIIDSVESDNFNHAWRIFGSEYDKPVSQLPTKTSLQKDYVEWLKNENKAGSGFGVKIYK